jgi:hypothetical protein
VCNKIPLLRIHGLCHGSARFFCEHLSDRTEETFALCSIKAETDRTFEIISSQLCYSDFILNMLPVSAFILYIMSRKTLTRSWFYINLFLSSARFALHTAIQACSTAILTTLQLPPSSLQLLLLASLQGPHHHTAATPHSLTSRWHTQLIPHRFHTDSTQQHTGMS